MEGFAVAVGLVFRNPKIRKGGRNPDGSPLARPGILGPQPGVQGATLLLILGPLVRHCPGAGGVDGTGWHSAS